MNGDTNGSERISQRNPFAKLIEKAKALPQAEAFVLPRNLVDRTRADSQKGVSVVICCALTVE